jgi:hypothetical protein
MVGFKASGLKAVTVNVGVRMERFWKAGIGEARLEFTSFVTSGPINENGIRLQM